MTESTESIPLTTELPLIVRVAIAKTYITALSVEQTLGAQPKDNLPHELWSLSLISEDLADAGIDACNTLGEEVLYLLVTEIAATTFNCSNCLWKAVTGEDENDD